MISTQLKSNGPSQAKYGRRFSVCFDVIFSIYVNGVASFCYCACVLLISRWSENFYSDVCPVAANLIIFMHGL